MDFHQVEPFAKSLLRFLESSHFSRPKPHGQFTDLMRCDRQRRICARFKRVTERSYYSREFAPRVDEADTRVRRQHRIEDSYLYRRIAQPPPPSPTPILPLPIPHQTTTEIRTAPRREKRG